ncbi:hypothetical protein AAFC00_006820 [Neodothiora populina]|uniref:Mitochondrial thiamine pyrophosphate carrier 1 n=1 Tax=Neodothiora populina TaxID=2781224 RepID=A0ABR3PBA2_9PEZI
MNGESPDERDARTLSLWKKLDSEKQGALDIRALKKGLKKIDHPLKNADGLIEDILDFADLNNDGRISYDEFRKFVLQTERELWSLFNSIDKDRDGHIDKSELRAAFVRAGLAVPNSRLDKFFADVDSDNDGVISFDEWRDFLLFLPSQSPGLKAVLSYYQSALKLTAEGDVSVSDDTIQGLGYFLAGGLSGVASRTTTAPLDRLKVYLIANTGKSDEAISAAKHGEPIKATEHAGQGMVRAMKQLWAAGGLRSLFAGNGINVIKVMPESAVKFGSYEAAKKVVARFEGHSDTKKIAPYSQFIAGGLAGMFSQAVVYPLDTLKFRMQCETVPGGMHGNQLIIHTAKKMWSTTGIAGFYRGLPMGLIGMFPYAAIDLGTFEYLKRTLTRYYAKKYGGHEEDSAPGGFTTALIGGMSGAFGASTVYPLNLLRTRLQSQGTASHPRTYTGIVDVTRQTIKGEGVRGLFKGLTPNLLKVVPAVSITYVVYEETKKKLHLK